MSGTVYERVRKVVCEELGVAETEVDEGKAFQEDLGADSLDTVELVMALEEEFGISIPDDDVNNLKTVGDAVKYIESNIE